MLVLQPPLMKLARRAVQAAGYFGEMFIAPLLAVILVAVSPLDKGYTALLVAAGIVTWTLTEYIFHRFVLHYMVTKQHGIHHAYPREPVLTIFWQIWACFAVVYLVAGGAFLAGSLVAYAWYLFVHHCTHHSVDRLPTFIVRNHNGHHKVATRNYGVTTSVWDYVFGTVLR
jgi:sterol desaturase/sphingolipid hydroxylase (fatty acid hydroxylase superfamily)